MARSDDFEIVKHILKNSCNRRRQSSGQIYEYSCLGINLKSDLVISGLSEGHECSFPTYNFTWGICEGEITRIMTNDWQLTGYIKDNLNRTKAIGWKYSDEMLVTIEDKYMFLILTNSREVKYVSLHPITKGGHGTRIPFIVGLLQHIKNHIVLHGSVVSVEGTGVLLLGPSGSGKSTLQIALGNHGAKVLSDDIVCFRSIERDSSVFSGPKSIRLTEDTARYFKVLESLHVTYDELNKVIISDLDNPKLFYDTSVIVKTIYWIERDDDCYTPSITTCNWKTGLIYLLKSSYGMILDSKEDQWRLSLRVSTVSRSIGVSRLRYKSSFTSLDEVCKLILHNARNVLHI